MAWNVNFCPVLLIIHSVHTVWSKHNLWILKAEDKELKRDACIHTDILQPLHFSITWLMNLILLCCARPHTWLCFQDWKFIRDLHQHTYYCSGRHSVYVMHKHFYKLFRACTLGMVLWNGILDACIREQRKKKKRDYLGQGNGWKTRILLTK